MYVDYWVGSCRLELKLKIMLSLLIKIDEIGIDLAWDQNLSVPFGSNLVLFLLAEGNWSSSFWSEALLNLNQINPNQNHSVEMIFEQDLKNMMMETQWNNQHIVCQIMEILFNDDSIIHTYEIIKIRNLI